MAIIRKSKNSLKTTKSSKPNFDIYDSEIPFIPAWELYKSKQTSISEQDVAAIAVALYLTLPEKDCGKKMWVQNSRMESISRRIP